MTAIAQASSVERLTSGLYAMALSTRPGLRLKIYFSIFVKEADIDPHLLLCEIRGLAPLPMRAGLIEPSLRKRLDQELRGSDLSHRGDTR